MEGKKMRLLPLLILLTACTWGDPEEPTPLWGDHALEVSRSFCAHHVECDTLFGHEDEQACVDFNYESLCALRLDCEEEVEPLVSTYAVDCAEDLEILGCGFDLPRSCEHLLIELDA